MRNVFNCRVLDEASALCRLAEDTRGETATAIAFARSLRRAARRFQGGSDGEPLDASLIATLISGSTLCLDCIARKTGVPVSETKTILSRVRGVLTVRADMTRCDACLRLSAVYRLG